MSITVQTAAPETPVPSDWLDTHNRLCGLCGFYVSEAFFDLHQANERIHAGH